MTITSLTEGMLNIDEAAAYTDQSVATVRRYVRDGRLKAWRVGAKLMFYPDDLKEAFFKPAGPADADA